MQDSLTRRRYKIVFALLTMVVALIFGRFASIMLAAPRAAGAAAGTTFNRERGAIYDRHGRVLALQTELDTVTAWTPHIRDLRTTATLLADILDLNQEELLERLRGNTGFLIIKRTVTPTESRQVRQLISAGNLPGIRLEPDTGRSYPERHLASHLLGYVGVDNVGLDGIEYSYNSHLFSPALDSTGSSAGNRLYLTIDLTIQSELERMAQVSLEEQNADSVILLAVDAASGEYLAYVSVPTFDPNTFDQYSAELRRNRPISMVYEPGSVFKVFSVASFLELGGLGPGDAFQTSGGYVSPDGSFTLRDVGNYGRLDAEGIIKYSSNVAAAYASEQVQADAFYHMIRRFGFGSPTDIGLNGEERGLLREPARWSARSKQTISIGQEIGVTANQIVAAATALANDGVLLKPHVVSRIVAPDGRIVRQFGREPVREVISPHTARTLLDFMRASTEDGGTARRIRIEGVEIAAKTGTAEVFDQSLGSYSRDAFVASTLAILPAESPRVILYAVIVHPRGESIYGSRIAVPLVREAAEFLIPYLGIPTARDQIARHSGRIAVSTPQLPELTATVPDYSGLPKRTLLPLLQREDLNVDIRGSGWVVRQSPPPGSAAEPGMTLRLDLE
ncbi:MAG: PASTA domain-containing protein [Spirochaetaceae bacterium]|nr:MAG: PASTA domain-containing protein [Spirochaetaceae bacterium]